MLTHYVRVSLLSPRFQNTSAKVSFIFSKHHLIYGRQDPFSPLIHKKQEEIPDVGPADAACSRLDQLSQFCLSTELRYFPVKTVYS